eukprot:2179752-Pyramimonas_sp.AAC.1
MNTTEASTSTGANQVGACRRQRVRFVQLRSGRTRSDTTRRSSWQRPFSSLASATSAMASA